MRMIKLYFCKDNGIRKEYSLKKQYFIFILFTCAIIAGCERESDLPDEPVITRVEFDESEKDLIIEFTDGDGDFGIGENNTDFPFYLDDDSTEVNPYYYNLWIDYFELRESEWVLVVPKSEFGFYYRVPDLTPEGQNKQLEVIFTNDMSAELPYPFAESDSIKFRVTLVDRAKNLSVPEETEPIHMPF